MQHALGQKCCVGIDRVSDYKVKKPIENGQKSMKSLVKCHNEIDYTGFTVYEI